MISSKLRRPETEGRMRGGLVLAVVVLVAGVVGIDEMNVIDAAAQHADELDLVWEGFFLVLPGARRSRRPSARGRCRTCRPKFGLSTAS